MEYVLTKEQTDIIAKVKDPHTQLLKVEAVAGSSKSYTSSQVSLAMGTGPQLYIVYSKAMQVEAKKDLRANVKVTTIHSFAYGPVMGKNYRLGKATTKQRTLTFMKARDLYEVEDWDDRYTVMEAMEVYFASKEIEVKDALKGRYEKPIIDFTVAYVTKMFEGETGMTHSGYLKYFHLLLAAKKIPTTVTYDLAILDECQDVSEVALEIFKLTKAHKYLIVGDSAQAIFASFTHTVNAFDLLEGMGDSLTLSKSFRVNQETALDVEVFCQKYINPKMQFKGMDYGKMPESKTHMFISRTNASMITKMIELVSGGIGFSSARDPSRIFELPLILISLKPNMKVYSAAYKFLEIDAKKYFGSPRLQKQHSTPLKYVLSQHLGDSDIESAINLVRKNSPQLIIEASKTATAYFKAGNKHPTWLATAHSSKGLTMDKVTLLPDMNKAFKDVLEDTEDTDLMDWTTNQRTEALLYYVACTRARYELEDAEYLI